jgi:hypothetical protein
MSLEIKRKKLNLDGRKEGNQKKKLFVVVYGTHHA